MDETARTLAISRLLRLDDTKSEFINSIGRPKDPLAERSSVIFALGMQKSEVEVLLSQNAPVSKPHIIEPFRKGGMLRDGVWIAKLWGNQDMQTAFDAQRIITNKDPDLKDFAIIARIVRCTRKKLRIRASEVAPGLTRYVIEKAKQYKSILENYNVKLVEKQGGASFLAINVSLDYFSEETKDRSE